jgi:hypothetical protein
MSEHTSIRDLPEFSEHTCLTRPLMFLARAGVPSVPAASSRNLSCVFWLCVPGGKDLAMSRGSRSQLFPTARVRLQAQIMLACVVNALAVYCELSRIRPLSCSPEKSQPPCLRSRVDGGRPAR